MSKMQNGVNQATICLIPYKNHDKFRKIFAEIKRVTENIIVIDNNHESVLKNKCQDVEYYHNGNKGMLAGATNLAVSYCKTKYFVYLCSNHIHIYDDTWLEDLIQQMEEMPNVVMGGDLLPVGRAMHIQGGIYIARTVFLTQYPYNVKKFPFSFMDVDISALITRKGLKMKGLRGIKSVMTKWGKFDEERNEREKKYKIVNSSRTLKKLIYTCNYGNYDDIKEPIINTPGWDYVMATDTPQKTKRWNVVVRKSDYPVWLGAREIKLMPELLFADYDLTIYIDASITVNVDLDEYVKRLSENADMAVSQHPQRFCVYEEIKACVKHLRITPEQSKKIYNKYKDDGITEMGGLVQCDIMIRKNNKHLNYFGKRWFEETRFTTRDQIAFMHTYHRFPISLSLFSAYESSKFMIKTQHNNGL